jgi:hypothetical protein
MGSGEGEACEWPVISIAYAAQGSAEKLDA